jgi:hypothetical protein
LAGVLDSDPANITVAIYVQQSVLVQVPGLCDFGWSKLNVKRVGVLKVLNLHGLNELSKKALCTVSIRQEYNPQILPFHLCNRRPATDALIALDCLCDRMINNVLNPLIANNRAIRTPTSGSKIFGGLHSASLGRAAQENSNDVARKNSFAAL